MVSDDHTRSTDSNIRKLHLDTCAQLGVEKEVAAEVEKLIGELTQLLIGICIMQV